jgi:hypothetical protein
MRRLGNRLTALLSGLALAGSLTFGVTSAFAEANTIPCRWDPITHLGACSTEQECDNRCIAYGGFDGECAMGCCHCAY